MHAEGLSAERHEYGTGTEVYGSEQQAGHAAETRMNHFRFVWCFDVPQREGRGPEVAPRPLLRGGHYDEG